ncbi:MAG: alanine--tRNA ligase [Gemmatimonadaceae bacterium]|nr:alanine--tRNA ligase [Gemmatimonadaceae bacterium]
MRASEIRSRFLDYFRRHQHAVLPSSTLVPGDDPTLLFTNAGMVQFKKVFLGLESPASGRRATTSQKCVRAGGKHNDLEQVGHTARHHTFFEMLGNFSFGDYFKRDAIRFAWEWVTGPQSAGNLGIDPAHLRVSVFREDDEARALWREVAGLPDSRIYGLGEKDNFWQMADTGPCGPCSEIYVDLAHLAKDWRFPEGAHGEWTSTDRTEFSTEAFIEGGEAGRFLEIWNLVFMQFDRQADGTLVPLPKPSVDTGAGLERIAAVMQGVTNNYHTDAFAPLIETIERVVGRRYAPRDASGHWALDEHSASFRVLADHARAVAFLLADGVFPSNEGRGYVLRRILRRAVRHAWLLGRREPTLVHVVQAVIDHMADVYPELRQRQAHLAETTRAEEERFLATIEGGMRRFDELAPAPHGQGAASVRGTVSGDDAFRLYDTFGFPIDLTELMARERGYTVDIAGFESALGSQRAQSQEERKSRKLGVDVDAAKTWAWETSEGQRQAGASESTRFVGYGVVEIESQVTAVRALDDGRVAVMLRETPFYAESGGQVSDHGEIVGEGWRVDVDDVRKFEGRTAAIGKGSGQVGFGRAIARVPSDRRRDTERNHTATHLLHAALRAALGDHVHQAGSLVAPDRLRFDFTHHGPVKPEVLAGIEETVNRGIWASVDVHTDEKPYQEAVASGAMALFGEKYGDVVRVVSIPGLSVELCGGTHVSNTGQISLFRILSETGVAAGVRRIEAVTGRGAYELLRERERTLDRVGEVLKATPDTVVRKVQALVDEKRALDRKLEDALRGGGDQVRAWVASAPVVEGLRLVAQTVKVDDARSLQAMGDALREQLGSGVAALGGALADGKATLLVVATDDARDRGARADAVVRELAALAGGRGGGKPHMAQAGIPDPARLGDGLAALERVVRTLIGA